MWLYLIRHGETKGNREKRYVGSTDEELTGEAVVNLMECGRRYGGLLSRIEKVAVSPMRRCRQTADILFPGIRQQVIEDFCECDFGEFEYCNFDELAGNAAYQQFIDSYGKCGFPGGEDRTAFQSRCVNGFEKLMQTEQHDEGDERITHLALVVHGGTIMALLDRYAFPHRDYYDWQADNGTGFIVEADRQTKTGQWRFNVVGILDFISKEKDLCCDIL
ncbi:MAG: histidine phosphatase family protein [Clostridium sp.]|nr:histidine phosphatase family protein [Clostridium sp.]